LFGVTTRRNTNRHSARIELMMNAVNINLVAFARIHRAARPAWSFTVFTICITVTERRSASRS